MFFGIWRRGVLVHLGGFFDTFRGGFLVHFGGFMVHLGGGGLAQLGGFGGAIRGGLWYNSGGFKVKCQYVLSGQFLGFFLIPSESEWGVGAQAGC